MARRFALDAGPHVGRVASHVFRDIGKLSLQFGIRQIAQFGWRCQQLGPCVSIDGQQLVALRIDIDQDTRAQLANAGIYCRNPKPEAYGGMELAA